MALKTTARNRMSPKYRADIRDEQMAGPMVAPTQGADYDAEQRRMLKEMLPTIRYGSKKQYRISKRQLRSST